MGGEDLCGLFLFSFIFSVNLMLYLQLDGMAFTEQ